MRIKQINNKKLIKVSIGLVVAWILFTMSMIILPGIKVIPWYISFGYVLLWIIIAFVFFCGCEPLLMRNVKKLEQSITTKTWTKQAESILPEVYVFDLSLGYLYGLFLLNPFQIQKIDLKEVKDVEVVIGGVKGQVTTCVICRIVWENGENDIYLQRHRKYHPMPWGCEEDLAYREEAEKLKDAILKWKVVAETREEKE